MITVNDIQCSVVDNCNNACACCSVASPVRSPRSIQPEILYRDLSALSKIIHAVKCKVIGGEPLIVPFPQLMGLIKACHDSGISDFVSITTNGKLLRKMPVEFWESQDWQHMHVSKYPNTPDGTIQYAQEMTAKYNKGLEHWPQFSFWTVRTRKAMSYEASKANFKACPWRWGCNEVRNGYFYRCSHSPHYAEVFYGIPESTQGIAIGGLTEQALSDFLNTDEPMQVCYTCHNHFDSRPWKEIRNKEQWLEDSYSSEE
jgi:hypothetical protein